MIYPKRLIRTFLTSSIKTRLFLVGSLLFIVIDLFLLNIFLLSDTSATKKEIPANPAPGLQMKDLLINRQRWEKLIKSDGPEKAYAEFIKEGSKLDSVYDQHANAHIMGELLYDTVGVKGVSICDSSFSFGCYHSFFAKAIAKEGVGIITKLDNLCNKTYGDRALGCSHGIGHGILYALGKDKLNESLLECEKLSYKEPIGGCTSGVFMEYNLNLMGDPSSSSIREYDGVNPHEPCTTVPPQFGQACYHEMPQWWAQVFSDREHFSTVQKLCSQVTDDLNRAACFQGTGNIIAPSTGYSVDKTISICHTMPTSTAVTNCLIGATWSFDTDPGREKEYAILCSQLSGKDQMFCQKRINDEN